MSFSYSVRVLALVGLLLGSLPAVAKKPPAPLTCPEIIFKYSYTPLYPDRAAQVRDEVRLKLPTLAKMAQQQAPLTDEEGVKKTVFALKLIAAFERAIKAYDRTQSRPPFPPIHILRDSMDLPNLVQPYEHADAGAVDGATTARPAALISPVGRPSIPRPIARPRRPPSGETQQRNKQLAVLITAEFDAFEEYTRENPSLSRDAKLMGILALGKKLARNIETWDPSTFRGEPMLGGGGPRALAMAGASPKGLAITAGGAQDAGHFKKLIEQGQVPAVDALSADGLLRELDLNIPFENDNLLAVKPAYLVDPVEKVIYVQLGTGSNVNAKNFKRNPVNVTVAFDISGSMSATDGTPHSRIEWAKASLKTLARKLRKGDTLSIILFDDRTDVFLEPTAFEDLKLADLERRIDAELHTRGSTDVERALTQAIKFAETQAGATRKGLHGRPYENRIVLMSDAGHNTGGTETGIVSRVQAAGDLGIGTTVIGLGVNFKQDLVDGFSRARGGNYLFVENGEQMKHLFDNFDFLVQPVAEDFRVAMEISGLPTARVERAWGVNARPGEQTSGLIAVPTLFFAGEGGGAMVVALRYGTPEDGPAMPGDAAPTTRPEDDRSGPAMP